ncbi:MAG: cysteine desulfurase-like protein [Caldilineaceae bacterium]|nr:cysteine desulfurase-like protein [Caldilineaceae bacterium]MDE0336987.1 cysteine desulfurase-like protein [Caldilineaceae bacterium]
MFDVGEVRKQFPALQEEFNGRSAIFFDNPGGTQVHESVIAAMVDTMTRRNSNTHGLFETSVRTDAVIEGAHRAAADLLGCDADEVVFGNNMTSLTFHISRSLAREWGPEDEVVVTRLDHDANVMPWVLAAQERGARVRWADVDVESGTLDMEDVRRQIGPRTKLVAVGYASNATGTINDVDTIIGWAEEVGALTFVDAVQYAPHGLVDVRALGCDFLACSAYKFFGPHSGQLYGKREQLERLEAYRVRPAGDVPPDKWETGTQNHEGMAGVTAAIDYLAGLGVEYGGAMAADSRREKLIAAWSVVGAYERLLTERLVTGLLSLPGVQVYGLTEREDWDRRVATVSLLKRGTTPEQLALALAEENIFAWNGTFYAQSVSERMGVEESGGWLRLGLVHYNTVEEIERCLGVLEGV